MAITQTVIIESAESARTLEQTLSESGQNGFRVTDISLITSRAGSAISLKRSGYWACTCLITLSQNKKKLIYRCRTAVKKSTNEQNVESLNKEIGVQNSKGFTLIKTLPLTGISENREYPTRGTYVFLMIFEKEI